MYSAQDPPDKPVGVAPFGNLRINACLRLPEAYRSYPRPSSPPDAKASTTRPYQLNLNVFLQIPFGKTKAKTDASNSIYTHF